MKDCNLHEVMHLAQRNVMCLSPLPSRLPLTFVCVRRFQLLSMLTRLCALQVFALLGVQREGDAANEPFSVHDLMTWGAVGKLEVRVL